MLPTDWPESGWPNFKTSPAALTVGCWRLKGLAGGLISRSSWWIVRPGMASFNWRKKPIGKVRGTCSFQVPRSMRRKAEQCFTWRSEASQEMASRWPSRT